MELPRNVQEEILKKLDVLTLSSLSSSSRAARTILRNRRKRAVNVISRAEHARQAKLKATGERAALQRRANALSVRRGGEGLLQWHAATFLAELREHPALGRDVYHTLTGQVMARDPKARINFVEVDVEDPIVSNTNENYGRYKALNQWWMLADIVGYVYYVSSKGKHEILHVHLRYDKVKNGWSWVLYDIPYRPKKLNNANVHLPFLLLPSGRLLEIPR